MKAVPRRAVGAALLLAVACASAPRETPRLPFDPPPAWPSATAPTRLAGTGADWWRQLGDPVLSDLVREALAVNPSLAAATARLEAALASARAAGAATRPQADVSLDGGRRRQSFIGLPIPGAEGGVLSNTSTSFALAAGVSWEADLWGRLRAGEGAAVARAGAAEADLAAVHLSLAGQVAKAWFAWLEAREQAALADQTVANRRQTREQIERRYREGLRPALDLRLALASEADAEAVRTERHQAGEVAARRLEVLLARYPGGDSLPPAPASLDLDPEPVPLGQPAELVIRRPDLIAAERRLAASGLDVAAARAALYPRLRLSGTVGRSSTDLADLLDRDFSIWSLALGLAQPLFQGGRLRAAVDAAEANRREAAAGYLAAALAAFSEVESALAAESHLAGRLTALVRASEQSEAARRLAEERYRAGLEGYLAVLEAQRQATSLHSRVLRARRERLDNRIDLHLALGGDYSTGAGLDAGAEAKP